jgi:hypothetical protein
MVVVTVPKFKISSGTCSKFMPQVARLPQSWLMDLWLPGAIQSGVVTALQYKTSFTATCNNYFNN